MSSNARILSDWPNDLVVHIVPGDVQIFVYDRIHRRENLPHQEQREEKGLAPLYSHTARGQRQWDSSMNQHQQYNLQSLRPPSRIHQDEMPTADGDLLLSPALTRIMSPVDSNVIAHGPCDNLATSLLLPPLCAGTYESSTPPEVSPLFFVTRLLAALEQQPSHDMSTMKDLQLS
ncbi:hypothetical protein P692DRAFT_201874135 [Suillus brevipes Sb2]|nr:hypothetical protein P692DRAFT_201874135 [Suillus brevipes Sb2]